MKRDWTPGPIAVALCAACVAVGALWLSYDRWPRGTAQAALWAVLTAACVWRANRNLRAELDAARRLLDAWNSSEARDELANSPAAGTPTVALYDQDAPTYSAGGTVDVGHLTVAGDATGWLGPEQILFRPPVLSQWQAEQMEPLTPAEADRLVANLRALPGERFARPPETASERMQAIVDSLPDGSMTIDSSRPTWTCDQVTTEGVCGQPSERCLKEPHGYVRLCDRHYDEAMHVIDSTEIPRGQGLARLAAASAAQEAALAYIRDHYDVPAYACGHVTVDGRQGIITGARDSHLLVVFPGADEHPMPCHPTWRVVYDRSDWHLGQPCARCAAPATLWVSDRPDPEIRDVTFLCDQHYADRTSEEDGRG